MGRKLSTLGGSSAILWNKRVCSDPGAGSSQLGSGGVRLLEQADLRSMCQALDPTRGSMKIP